MTREEAIENLKGLLESNYVDSFEDAENEALKMAIKTLEQEPCEDAISRKDAKISLMQFMRNQKSLCECIDDCSSVQPKVKTGHWVESNQRKGHYWCSVCGCLHVDPETGEWRETFDFRYPYCPNCGARMEER